MTFSAVLEQLHEPSVNMATITVLFELRTHSVHHFNGVVAMHCINWSYLLT